MEPMISVIIPEFEDDTYLIRCLNSLKRQTYKALEIIIAGYTCNEKIREDYGIVTVEEGDYWEKLNLAIKISKGEYIFFYDVNSVMGTNVLQDLYENVESSILYYGQCLYQSEKNFLSIENEKFSIYGKIFRKDFLQKEKNFFRKESLYPELEFVIKYIHIFESVFADNSVYIYMRNREFIQSEDFSFEKVQFFIESLFSIEPKELENLLWRILKTCPEEKQIDILLMIAENTDEAWNLNYVIAQKYLKTIYMQCIGMQNEKTFKSLKKYFLIFREKKYFLHTLLSLINMTEKQLDIFLEVPLDEYIFLQDKFQDILPDEKMSAINVIKPKDLELIENNLKIITKKIEDIKLEPQYKEKIVTVDRVLSGPALAEDVIEKYRQGKLGIKTIVKSLVAWFKFKF